MRLRLLGAPDGTLRAVILASADHAERDVARRLFALALRGGETIVCDNAYAGAELAAHAASVYGAAVLRPASVTAASETSRTNAAVDDNLIAGAPLTG